MASGVTPEKNARAKKLQAEGKDPFTGKEGGKNIAPCPACDIKAEAAQEAKNKAGAAHKPEDKGGAA
jgi:hypothetical protein